jgi:hypothetical protein
LGELCFAVELKVDKFVTVKKKWRNCLKEKVVAYIFELPNQQQAAVPR